MAIRGSTSPTEPRAAEHQNQRYFVESTGTRWEPFLRKSQQNAYFAEFSLDFLIKRWLLYFNAENCKTVEQTPLPLSPASKPVLLLQHDG